MSRRKQSKPRQIKRSLGDLDSGEENTADNLSLSGEEGGASDPDDSAEDRDSSSPPPFTPLYSEEPQSQDSRGGPEDEDQAVEEQAPVQSGEDEEDEGEDEKVEQWSGPVTFIHIYCQQTSCLWTRCPCKLLSGPAVNQRAPAS